MPTQNLVHISHSSPPQEDMHNESSSFLVVTTFGRDLKSYSLLPEHLFFKVCPTIYILHYHKCNPISTLPTAKITNPLERKDNYCQFAFAWFFSSTNALRAFIMCDSVADYACDTWKELIKGRMDKHLYVRISVCGYMELKWWMRHVVWLMPSCGLFLTKASGTVWKPDQPGEWCRHSAIGLSDVGMHCVITHFWLNTRVLWTQLCYNYIYV